MRAAGLQPRHGGSAGHVIWAATIGGVGLAGAFSATSGALMVQSQGFADVNMGIGTLINGLAALMIEAIVGKQTIRRQLAAPSSVPSSTTSSPALPCRRHAADRPEARHRPRARHAGAAHPCRARGPMPARETVRE